MGKQKGAVKFTGKLNDVVGYKIANSAAGDAVGVRAYQSTVANPQTTPQATQRMRMKPAINFYRGLADLLDHSWEGVKYGALSRQKFMQMALSANADFLIPFVVKGETRFIPGEYPISLGSVPVPTSFVTNLGHNIGLTKAAFLASLTFPDVVAEVPTWGEWSKNTIDINGGLLRDGDELTFVAVYDYANGYYVARHSYVVLDTSSSLNTIDVMNSSFLTIVDETFGFNNGDVRFGSDGEFFNDYVSYDIVAAGLIVSRHPSRQSTTWLRTNSRLYVSDDFKAEFMSNDALQLAVASYQTRAADLTSDWLLNQAGGSASTGQSIGGGGSVSRSTVANVSCSIAGGRSECAVVTPGDGSGAKSLVVTRNNQLYLTSVQGQKIIVWGNQPFDTDDVFDPPYMEAERAISLYLPNYELDLSGLDTTPPIVGPGD